MSNRELGTWPTKGSTAAQSTNPGIVRTPAEEAPAQTSRAGVDARDDPLPVLGAQLDVVRDHEPARVHADEPAPEHVVTEEHLSLASLEVGEVEILSGELRPSRFHVGDPVSGNEEPPAGDASDQAGDRRIAALSESGNDVVHTAEPAPSSIDEGAVDDPGERQPDRFGGWLPGV